MTKGLRWKLKQIANGLCGYCGRRKLAHGSKASCLDCLSADRIRKANSRPVRA